MTTTTKAKSKQQVACEYFPDVAPHSAVNHLCTWIKRCTGLMQALTGTGYRPRDRLLTAKQVALIYEYLGEP